SVEPPPWQAKSARDRPDIKAIEIRAVADAPRIPPRAGSPSGSVYAQLQTVDDQRAGAGAGLDANQDAAIIRIHIEGGVARVPAVGSGIADGIGGRGAGAGKRHPVEAAARAGGVGAAEYGQGDALHAMDADGADLDVDEIGAVQL